MAQQGQAVTKLFWVLNVLALGCATTAPPASVLPTIAPPRDLEVVIGPAPEHKIPGGLARYPDIPIDRGVCPGKPEGILVSEGVYADQLVCKLERDRLQEETAALRQLRTREYQAAAEAELAFRARIVELEKRAAAAERSATNRLRWGVAIGAAGMLFTVWATRTR